MNTKNTVKISKFLSLVLRHKPQTIGLQLDKQGWADTQELIDKCNEFGKKIDRKTLIHVVETNNKKRFSFNEDGSRIRASQGHSIKIDLGYTPLQPPTVLYHGTATRFLSSIWEKGLIKKDRHHVHLSADKETAQKVGARHGKPVILLIDALEMHRQGHAFFKSENDVWLTERVPNQFIRKSE